MSTRKITVDMIKVGLNVYPTQYQIDAYDAVPTVLIHVDPDHVDMYGKGEVKTQDYSGCACNRYSFDYLIEHYTTD